MKILRYASFTDDPATGNPAGVVLSDQHPSDQHPSEGEMQRIAAEVGYSETVFATMLDDGTVSARYFSPVGEVDFCGHATIALAVALGETGRTDIDVLTNVGVVAVEIDHQPGSLPIATMSAAAATMHAIDADGCDDLLAALDLDRSELDPAIAVVVGDSGNLHPVVALRDRDRLSRLDYDFDRLRELCLRHGWVTIQVVCADAPGRWSARSPFPFGGVREDPATGSAAIALAACLRDLDLVPVPSRFIIEQGRDMGRTSTLIVDVDGPGKAIRVSGTAVRIE